MTMLRAMNILLIAAFTVAVSPAFGQSDLIAIDMLIQPGQKMMDEAGRWHARLREHRPEGFELDEEHAPHVTLVQRFIAKSDLPKVSAVIDAVSAYARQGGGESAFVPDSSGTPFDPRIFSYVDTVVPQQTGEKFNPHVTIGVAPLDWLKAWEEKPFDNFSFGARGIATYELGNFGTASKRLDLEL
jgi:hypothetical protein